MSGKNLKAEPWLIKAESGKWQNSKKFFLLPHQVPWGALRCPMRVGGLSRGAFPSYRGRYPTLNTEELVRGRKF